MTVELQPIDSISRETLTDLIYSIFPEPHSHWDIQEEIEESFKDIDERMSAIAWKKDKPIGAIICVDRNGIQIDHIGVIPNHQRMGVGRMLLRYAVDNAEESIMSRIPKDNQAIMELMEEEGFEEVAEENDHYIYKYEMSE
ncbi:MAG: GNAT family N-acetyltransferase [Candidatus Thermoplasmatota archaeon]